MSKNSEATVGDFNTTTTKFSVLSSSSIETLLQTAFPLAKRVPFTTIEDVLNAVKDGTGGVTATFHDYAVLTNCKKFG